MNITGHTTTKSMPIIHRNKEFVAHHASEWSTLFDRKSGWTGADGIYSIPMTGKETFNEFSKEKTVFLFSDTFISDVDNNNKRHNNFMINNTYAVMNGNKPHDEGINFNWNIIANNQPEAIFKPDSKYAKKGDWFWLMDGISIGSHIYIFALRLSTNPAHIFNFKIMGVSLITTSLNDTDKIDNYSQQETALFYKGESDSEDIVFGQAIMPLTQASQNPVIDGYIYIYGPRGALIEKELLAARVKEDKIITISEWRYWNGNGWSLHIEDCFPVSSGISQEFSVSPLVNGQFILVFQRNNKVGIRLGDSPVGPFGPIKYIWDCSETGNDPDIYVYNAKAHPHLSSPGELLISYNVNCHTLERHDIEADLYRPRFISLKLDFLGDHNAD